MASADADRLLRRWGERFRKDRLAAGVLIGEQVVPVGKQLILGSGLAAAWRQAQCAPHIFGLLPGRQADAQTDALALMPDVAKEKRS